MGVVDLATGPHGERVAIKRIVLTGTAREVNEARIRIRREADALHVLDHPNIVGLLAVHDDGDELVLVLPYLDGGTLAERVHAFGPLSSADVDRMMHELLSALATA